MRGDAHVRFGGRAEETDQPKDRHRASARPNPASWDDQKIISEVEDVARNPDYPPELQENGRWKIQGTRDGVTMTVVVNSNSEIYSAFPRHGPGVIHNDEHGNPKPIPTER